MPRRGGQSSRRLCAYVTTLVTVAPRLGRRPWTPFRRETPRLRPETHPSLGCKFTTSPCVSNGEVLLVVQKLVCESTTMCWSLSETAKNCSEPIFMGEYWGNSILISIECVKWLSDQICRNSCKFGRSATITLRTLLISECYCPAL